MPTSWVDSLAVRSMCANGEKLWKADNNVKKNGADIRPYALSDAPPRG
jgi:hypothetical protein